MSNIAEIERAVERLAPSELTAFRAWFVAFDADAWDREMQDDEAAGRLDALASEAREDLRVGRCTDLCPTGARGSALVLDRSACRLRFTRGPMKNMRILAAEVRGSHRLWLSFSDGTRAEVDVRPLLGGTIFEPLQEPDYFARVVLDPICGTVVWPNGADFAPESLRALVAVSTAVA